MELIRIKVASLTCWLIAIQSMTSMFCTCKTTITSMLASSRKLKWSSTKTMTISRVWHGINIHSRVMHRVTTEIAKYLRYHRKVIADHNHYNSSSSSRLIPLLPTRILLLNRVQLYLPHDSSTNPESRCFRCSRMKRTSKLSMKTLLALWRKSCLSMLPTNWTLRESVEWLVIAGCSRASLRKSSKNSTRKKTAIATVLLLLLLDWTLRISRIT